MDFKELVIQARACRRYIRAEAVARETFEWLIDCARLTSSARNQQALRYMVVDSPEGCAAMTDALVWAGSLPEWDGPTPEEQPAGYVVICTEESAGKMVHIDLGIAGQTLQLAAMSRGLGACMFLSCNVKKVSGLLRLPEPWHVALVVSVGKPGETRVLDKVPADGNLAYWRDAHSVHHVPKLDFDTVFFGYR